ncbi:hypothetical protein CPAV1605_421 [seawater metagenome]|uniref:Uncharacterized protein n=1 Tax=seawater metagenome TaxID=1561972 RepID=A0A5E8CHZ7_9ZZZZ
MSTRLSLPNKQQAHTGVVYFSLFVSSIFWLGSDIYFLVNLAKIKNEEDDSSKEANCIKKSNSNSLSFEILFIILLLMMEFVFKYKLSSFLASFSGKSSNLIIVIVTGLLVLPTFISYNVIETYETRTYSISSLNSLIAFHSINLIIKVCIIAACFFPKFQNTKFIEFFKSTSLNYETSVAVRSSIEA